MLETKESCMPVIAKFCGIVVRVLMDRTFGRHFHVFYGDAELVIGLNPLRVIQGDAPSWVQAWALDWIEHHQRDRFLSRKAGPTLTAPITLPMAGQFASAD